MVLVGGGGIRNGWGGWKLGLAELGVYLVDTLNEWRIRIAKAGRRSGGLSRGASAKWGCFYAPQNARMTT